MSEITILHLSDIHFTPRRGDPIRKIDEKNKTFRQKVQNELIDAVETHAKQHGSLDFVAVTAH
jgi:hypothetical protein